MEHIVRPLLKAGSWLKAQQAIERYLNGLSSPSVEQLAEAAYWRCQANDFVGATHLYQQVCLRAPAHPTYHYNLASTLRITGDISGADVALSEHIRKNPDDAEAHWLKVQLGRQTYDHRRIAQLTKLTEEKFPPKQRVHAWYALGKQYEDLRRDEASFNAYKTGADLRRRYLKYSVANDKAIMQTIETKFSSQWFDETKGKPQGESAVFIVGMPRSGTTLVENLLGAHQEVSMGGELNTFASSMMEDVARGGTPASIEQAISRATMCDFSAIGRSYLTGTRDYASKTRLTDKLPLNFLYLGLIHKALPNAKIIHMTRHPMDTLWSIYKHLFTHAYPFSYNLAEIADYYIAYRALMAHWEQLFSRVEKSPLLTVNYETLVANPEAEMQRISRFCQVDYDPNCFNFYQRPSSVTTGSAAQVREPIHSHGIGQWQRYASQLVDVQEKLAGAGLL
ncbi:hypothetical protein GTH32_09190 [Alteromonas sp. 345S023]|uniref:Sulfotransferase family protein n=1 Tax=Alteromonas profundi TaxID=2696062 RepID=A0A7X5RKY3_9ALTE|nr:sulfotransferase [Alteromonas profundi]NDV91352.1 hypothetical protein [Alteromonas profundi]